MMLFSTAALCCHLLGFYKVSGSPTVTNQFDDASKEEEEGDLGFYQASASMTIVTGQFYDVSE